MSKYFFRLIKTSFGQCCGHGVCMSSLEPLYCLYGRGNSGTCPSTWPKSSWLSTKGSLKFPYPSLTLKTKLWWNWASQQGNTGNTGIWSYHCSLMHLGASGTGHIRSMWSVQSQNAERCIKTVIHTVKAFADESIGKVFYLHTLAAAWLRILTQVDHQALLHRSQVVYSTKPWLYSHCVQFQKKCFYQSIAAVFCPHLELPHSIQSTTVWKMMLSRWNEKLQLPWQEHKSHKNKNTK